MRQYAGVVFIMCFSGARVSLDRMDDAVLHSVQRRNGSVFSSEKQETTDYRTFLSTRRKLNHGTGQSMTRLNPFSLSIIVHHPVKYALGSLHAAFSLSLSLFLSCSPLRRRNGDRRQATIHKNLVSLFNTRAVLIVDKIP